MARWAGSSAVRPYRTSTMPTRTPNQWNSAAPWARTAFLPGIGTAGALNHCGSVGSAFMCRTGKRPAPSLTPGRDYLRKRSQCAAGGTGAPVIGHHLAMECRDRAGTAATNPGAKSHPSPPPPPMGAEGGHVDFAGYPNPPKLSTTENSSPEFAHGGISLVIETGWSVREGRFQVQLSSPATVHRQLLRAAVEKDLDHDGTTFPRVETACATPTAGLPQAGCDVEHHLQPVFRDSANGGYRTVDAETCGRHSAGSAWHDISSQDRAEPGDRGEQAAWNAFANCLEPRRVHTTGVQSCMVQRRVGSNAKPRERTDRQERAF